MKYIRYGITMSLMKEEDIEMVRQWRNDPVVVRNYQYREHITPEMQKAWFKTVNNINNLYTIIEFNGEKIGVINMKNIDWDKRSFESGIFIPYEKFHNTPVLAIVSIITTEIIFTLMNWPVGYAHVLKENKSTQSFIKMLGYERLPGQEDEPNQAFMITREKFAEKRKKLRKALSVLLENPDEPARLVFDQEERSDPVIAEWELRSGKGISVSKVEETEKEITYYFT